MKKVIFVALTIILTLTFAIDGFAKAKKAKQKNCPGGGHCYLLMKNGNMEAWRVGNPNKIYDDDISLDVMDMPIGYQQTINFFIPENELIQNIGEGVINGLIYFSDFSPVAYFYEFDESLIFSDYQSWKNALPPQ